MEDWLRGATFDDKGDTVSPPFDDDETFCAWYVFSEVRAFLKANGSPDFPRDLRRAALWAATQWVRAHNHQMAGGAKH